MTGEGPAIPDADGQPRGQGASAVVEIDGERVVLGSVGEFEQWLVGYAGSHARATPSGDLARLADVARWLGKSLPRLVARPEAAREAVDELLSRSDCEGAWRELLCALAPLPGAFDEHRLLALARYRQFILRAAGDGAPASDPPAAAPARAFRSLDALFDAAEAARPDIPVSPPSVGGLSLEPLEPPLDGVPAPEAPSEALDLAPRAGARPRPMPSPAPAESPPTTSVFARRLPRGERVAIDAGDGPLELRLASRSFVLTREPALALVDDHGRSTRLKDGRNIVGRVPYADVVIDESYVDVSRRHVIIDIKDGLPVALTDLSSRGTFVDAERVDALSDP